MDIANFVAQAGGIGWVLLAFIVALSIIVAIHEYGHYIVARWCGIDSEVFSIGFGPVLLSRTDKRGTRWQIAALPFGGFVKFVGDANVASVGHDETVKAARNTIHGAPLWARAATVAAGPVFNFVLAALVFAGVFLYRGEPIEPLTIEELRPSPIAAEFTLEPGDIVQEIEGQTIPELAEFRTLADALPDAAVLNYTVTRDGNRVQATGPYPYPPVVVSVSPQSASMDAGLEVGDVITAVNGNAIDTFTQLQDAVRAVGGSAVSLDVWREGTPLEFTLVPRQVDLPRAEGGFETRYLIGITGGTSFVPMTASPGMLTALGDGIAQTWFIIKSSISGLWHVATGAISSCNISGPVGIAETSGAMASQGTLSFITFIAVLSAAVGLFNLFPVPMLDGGHLVFHAYEAVTGRPPSNSALQAMMTAGLTLVLGLMVFALANDLFLC